MRLTKQTYYAVAALFEIIGHNSGETKVQKKDIAAKYKIPTKFLEQILATLQRNNVIKSFRGPGGGYILQKPPDKIKLSNIIEIFEGKVSFCPADINDNIYKNITEELERNVKKIIDISISELYNKKIELETKNPMYYI